MLIIITLSAFFSLFLPKVAFPFLLFFSLLFYFTSLNMGSISPLNSDYFFIVQDEVSVFIVLLLFFILFICFLVTFTYNHTKLVFFLFFILLISCYVVYSTLSLFWLYIFFEVSLLPIFFIIVKWGSYPERSNSIIMIFMYTLLFSVPFLFLIFITYSTTLSWCLFSFDFPLTPFSSLLLFLCFSVKLPIYGLHFWLPIAHVEAPVFGSVILASLLLKLGGVGLFRVSSLLDFQILSHVLLGYLRFFLAFSVCVCCFQSDFKRLIAYSSVAHIMTVPFLILNLSSISSPRIILIMLFHGFSSSLLFLSVGILYSFYSSRLLIIMRGLLSLTPSLSLLLVLSFFYTLSAPPFPSFVSEVFFILSSLSLRIFFLPFFLIFLFSFLLLPFLPFF